MGDSIGYDLSVFITRRNMFDVEGSTHPQFLNPLTALYIKHITSGNEHRKIITN